MTRTEREPLGPQVCSRAHGGYGLRAAEEAEGAEAVCFSAQQADIQQPTERKMCWRSGAKDTAELFIKTNKKKDVNSSSKHLKDP